MSTMDVEKPVSAHLCLAGSGCGSSTTENGERKPAKTESPESLCKGCEKSVQRSVEELPETWLSLSLAIGDKSVRPGEHVSGTRQPPIPLNTDVAAAMDNICDWLTVAAARVADALNLDDNPEAKSRTTSEQARVVQASCQLLEIHLDKLLDSPADAVTVWRKTGESTVFIDKSGIDIGLELVKAHRNARRILGHTKPRFLLSLPCPDCDSATLYRTVDKTDTGIRDEVQCDSCRITWPYSRYQQLALIFVQAQEEHDMEYLKWLLAEQHHRAECHRWLSAERAYRISHVRRLTEIDPNELNVELVFQFLREDVLGEVAA